MTEVANAWLEEKDIPRDSFFADRMLARKRFLDLGIPTSRHEEWRFTALRARINPAASFTSISSLTDKQCPTIGLSGLTLHWHNGRFSSMNESLPVGAAFYSFEVAQSRPDIKQYLQSVDTMSDNALWQLNQATSSEGWVLHLTKDMAFDCIINMVHTADGLSESDWVNTRLVVVTESEKSVFFREFFNELGAGIYNHAASFFVASNARLIHAAIRNQAGTARLITQQETQIQANGQFYSTSFFTGGDFTRNTAHACLMGSGAHAELNGVYTPAASQLTDNHILIDHRVPDCTSSQLFKGILQDQSTAVFNGKIFVKPDAQRTRAYQSSKAVLISDSCTIHAKPQLEIFADDVKCSHGAAIGQLNDQEIFYLRARGIDPQTARAMILNAFVQDVVSAHPDEEIQAFFHTYLAQLFLPMGYDE
jgi:Fe-S cluster assembly protein SufD